MTYSNGDLGMQNYQKLLKLYHETIAKNIDFNSRNATLAHENTIFSNQKQRLEAAIRSINIAFDGLDNGYDLLNGVVCSDSF